MTASRPRVRYDTSVNYYQVLDVAPGASGEEITRAYRRLMRLTHPDTVQEPIARARAEERAKLLNAAYAVLSRPESRREYDAQLRVTAVSDALMQRYTGSTPGRPPPTRPRPRTPSPRVARAQRRAYASAVRQLMFSTAAFVFILMAIAIVLMLAWRGLTMVIG